MIVDKEKNKMTDDDLDRFLESIAHDIYDDDDLSPDKIRKYLALVKVAVEIIDTENSCGCLLMTKEMIEFREYIRKILGEK